MSFSDFFKPKWRHSNPDVRMAEIARITDQEILTAISQQDRDAEVREAAIRKVTQEHALYCCAIYDQVDGVRLAALERITDQRTVERLAAWANGNPAVQLAAIERVTDPDALAPIVQDDENPDVRMAAGRRQEALVDAEKAMFESGAKISVLGMDVPVIKDRGIFSRTVQRRHIPVGLLIAMDEFTDTYGGLLNSVPDPEMGGFNPFHISARKGPCRLLCAGCKELLPDSFLFGLSGAASRFRGGVLVQHLETGHAGACPNCGGNAAVIAYSPDRTE